MIKSVKNVKEKNCCGCGACYQICPQKSIKMQENVRGFLIPIVDENTCINCGLCIKVCPELNQPNMHEVIAAYAAITKDLDRLKTSTSGGIFSVLASSVLSKGGAVYGCAWNQNLYAHHKKIERIENMSDIQKSKYVQSDTVDTFLEVKNDLRQGRMVLYSGTACQIAGLRKFLNREENGLVTVEIACHGVPSPGLFRKYIDWKSDEANCKVIGIQFRNKEKHKKGEHYMFCLKYENGKEKYALSNEDPYYGSFLEGRTLRETCYKCKYKQNRRVGDLLLADYWGIEKEHKSFPAKYGASAVVITSEKGQNLFEISKGQMIAEKSTFEQITLHNKSIICSSKCNTEKKIRTIEMNADTFFGMLKPTFNIKKRVRNMIPEEIKCFLKRIYI